MITAGLVVAVICVALAKAIDYLGRDRTPHVTDAWLRALYRERRDL